MKVNSNVNNVSADRRLAPTLTYNAIEAARALRLHCAKFLLGIFALALVGGCATTTETNEPVVMTQIPRPGNILVYDFVATASDVPDQSLLAAHPEVDTTAQQTPEQLARGRKVGAELAAQLAADIRALGMPAEEASRQMKPRIDDIVLQGYILSIQQGSGVKRIIIGFGSGASELKVAVEGFQMTATGLRRLGSGTVMAKGGKGPGEELGLVSLAATANPAGLIISSGVKVYGEASGRSTVEGRIKAAAKEITAVLKTRFEEEGWIE